MPDLVPPDAAPGWGTNQPTTHECRRCDVQWQHCDGGLSPCWACGLPGLVMPRCGNVIGMSLSFPA